MKSLTRQEIIDKEHDKYLLVKFIKINDLYTRLHDLMKRKEINMRQALLVLGDFKNIDIGKLKKQLGN